MSRLYVYTTACRAARAVSIHQSIKTGRFSLRNLSRQRTLRREASKEAAQGSGRRASAPVPAATAPSAEVLPSDGSPDLEDGLGGVVPPKGSAVRDGTGAMVNGGTAGNGGTTHKQKLTEASPFSFTKGPPGDEALSRTGSAQSGLARQQTLPSQLRINTGLERKSMLARCGVLCVLLCFMDHIGSCTCVVRHVVLLFTHRLMACT